MIERRCVMHQEAKSSPQRVRPTANTEPTTAGSSRGEHGARSNETRDVTSLLQRSIMNLKANPLRDRKNIWTWCVVASAVVILLYIVIPSPYRSASVLLGIVGSFWALTFY